jgi:hypothetical protein
MSKWGKIKFDELVRKTGRATGVTYGVVAGIYADWKSAKFPQEAMKEYYILRDEILDEQSDISKIFAWKGDSGASVIDYRGRIVGFISVAVEVPEIQVVCDPLTKHPDFRELARRRNKETGQLDTTDAWFESFYRIKLVFLQDARMVRQHAGLPKDPEYIVLDN